MLHIAINIATLLLLFITVVNGVDEDFQPSGRVYFVWRTRFMFALECIIRHWLRWDHRKFVNMNVNECELSMTPFTLYAFTRFYRNRNRNKNQNVTRQEQITQLRNFRLKLQSAWSPWSQLWNDCIPFSITTAIVFESLLSSQISTKYLQYATNPPMQPNTSQFPSDGR